MFWEKMGRRALFSALLITLVAHQVHCTEKNKTVSAVADTSLTASASYLVDPQQQPSSSRDTWLQPTGRGTVQTVDYNPVYRSQTEKTNSISSSPVIHQNRRSSYFIASPTANHQFYGRPQLQRIRPRPMLFRRQPYFVANRRQFVNSVPSYLTAPRPPPAMSKTSIVSRSPPHPQHVIYTKRPPEVIYYGPKPPPLDYSPPSSPPIYSKPSISSDEYSGSSPISYRVPIRRPIISGPVQYGVPQEPADHDIMNDLDKYIPDNEPPSKSDSSYSPMTSMMMPLMMLGLTLPMIGMAATYFARRRRRRRDVTNVGRYSEVELNRILNLLASYTEKSKKIA